MQLTILIYNLNHQQVKGKRGQRAAKTGTQTNYTVVDQALFDEHFDVLNLGFSSRSKTIPLEIIAKKEFKLTWGIKFLETGYVGLKKSEQISAGTNKSTLYVNYGIPGDAEDFLDATLPGRYELTLFIKNKPVVLFPFEIPSPTTPNSQEQGRGSTRRVLNQTISGTQPYEQQSAEVLAEHCSHFEIFGSSPSGDPGLTKKQFKPGEELFLDLSTRKNTKLRFDTYKSGETTPVSKETITVQGQRALTLTAFTVPTNTTEGQYEVKVYIDDVLVSTFRFEVVTPPEPTNDIQPTNQNQGSIPITQ